jgi:hypothetical protein
MRRAAAGAAVERKNADHYSQELCAIMNVPSTRLNKLELFDKIFEILNQDVIRSMEDTPLDVDYRLWYNTCTKYCGKHSTKGVLDLLRDVFYTEGKPILYTKTGMITHNIGLPRVLFFELLLHLIEQLSEKAKHDYNKEYFEGIITIVNDGDNSGILSYGVSDIDYFIFVTNENVEKIIIKLGEIDFKFTTTAPRQGNYTLAHVISSYCNLILRKNGHCSLPQSQPDSQPDSDPNSLMNVPCDWRGNIQLATQDDIRAYNTHKVSEERRQKIEDTKRRDAEQVAKLISEREEYARRMSEKKKPDDMKQKDDRPECFYDGVCYQRGAEHWRDFQHKKQQGPIPRKGGRRSQSKRSKYNTVRYSLSSTKRPHTKRPHRHTRRRRTKHRRH